MTRLDSRIVPFSLSCLLLLSATRVFGERSSATRPPNFIVIYCDNLEQSCNSTAELASGQVALGDFSPRAPTDPYVPTLEHTVHPMMDSPCSNAAYPECYPGPCC